jgi:2-polyprenyl-3-methyl-5-hydroxy-6-metoxy-1,4-benzoquinol methylase
MKRTGNDQINTRVYWNYIYENKAKQQEYWSKSDRFYSLVEEIHDGDKFVDLGCGVCVPGSMIHEKYKECEIWGIDISNVIIDEYSKQFPYMKLQQGYIGNINLPKDYFDVVFSGEVIEHLDKPQELFIDAYKLLKKDGKLIITTPREEAIYSNEHIWEFTEKDIEKFYKDNGFSNVVFKKLKDMEHLKVIFAMGSK